jgi:hypothetical protein
MCHEPTDDQPIHTSAEEDAAYERTADSSGSPNQGALGCAGLMPVNPVAVQFGNSHQARVQPLESRRTNSAMASGGTPGSVTGADSGLAWKMPIESPGSVRAMVRIVRWLAGAVFGLSLAALVPFLVEKGAEPKGHAVSWVLYGLLGISAVAWLAATIAARFDVSRGPKPLSIIYSLNGHRDLRVRLRPGRPEIALLEVDLKNPNPVNLEGIAINSLIPQGLRIGRCGIHGELLEGGHWLTTSEQLPDEPSPGAHKEYWADENVTVAGNGTKLLFFKLRLTESGTFYLKTKLFGNIAEQDEFAQIEVIESDDLTFGGSISELIHDAEQMLEEMQNFGNVRFYNWTNELVFMAAALPGEDRRWWDVAQKNIPRGGLEDEHNRRLAAGYLPLLYDLRRRLARPAEPVTEQSPRQLLGNRSPNKGQECDSG